MRIVPFIEPKLSDMQAGFRPARGCRDNILILAMSIHHLIESAADDTRSLGIITYIDFVAAFDSVLHSYLLTALKQYGVPLKYCRLVEAIYESATVRVRIQEAGGARSYSRNIAIKRGVIQGDIPSPVCFLVALDKLMKEHGGLNTGIQITNNLMLSELEFADAAIPNKDTITASLRLSNLDRHAKEQAGMTISIPKTKVQHIRPRPRVSETTENDVTSLPAEKQFQHKCDACEMTYPTRHGLSVHKGRWCKRNKRAKKPSRKGTVCDRIIKRIKVEQYQNTLDTVKMGNAELENVYSFVYLGAEIAGDGDNEVTVSHRIDVAWGRYAEYRAILTSTKLPVSMRVRFYVAVIISTMIYGCCAWLLTDIIKRKLNGVNSKMLAMITRNAIHKEAADPTFNIIDYVLQRRWRYLGHVLRLDKERSVRRYLLELSPREAPFIAGSLLSDTRFETVDDMIEAAANREQWQQTWTDR